MIIQHNKFKKAVFDISQQAQKDYPNERFHLESASKKPRSWVMKLDIETSKDEVGDYSTPSYSIWFDEVDDEDITLESTFVNVHKVDRAVEIADRCIKNMKNISKATLIRLQNELPIWSIMYGGQDDNGDDILITVEVDVKENVVVSSKMEPWPK